MRENTKKLVKLLIHQYSKQSATILPLLNTPALMALLIQCFAMVCVLTLVWINIHTFQVIIPVVMLCTAQGIIASICAIRLMRDSWWRYIHFAFPFAIYAAWSLKLPKEIYLAGFLIVAGFFWTCFKTRVPYYPSSEIVWKRVRELLPDARPLRLIDIGSGLGGLIFNIEKQVFGLQLSGIETAPVPWFISQLRKYQTGSKAKFILGDYNSLNFGDFDVIFAYLSPAAMVSLYLKAIQEMRPDTILISQEFEIPDVKATHVITAPENERPTYVYVMTEQMISSLQIK